MNGMFRRHKLLILIFSVFCLFSILSGKFHFFRKPDGPLSHILPLTKEQLHQAHLSAHNAFIAYETQLSSDADNQPSLLCHTIIMRGDDTLLRKNIALAGGQCHWAVTWLIRKNEKLSHANDLASYCREQQSHLAFEQDFVSQHKFFNKVFVWKTLLPILTKYSHIWLLDSDISFKPPANISLFFEAWRCGSSAKFPPIISQPTIINREGESQSVQFLNHKENLLRLGISSIKTEHCEIQAPIVASAFMSWLLRELIEPYIADEREFSLNDWGIDFMWCKAADFFQSSGHHSLLDGPDRPSVSCALIPQPVVHFSTDTIRRVNTFLDSGEIMLQIYKKRFPTMYKLERQQSDFNIFLSNLTEADLRSPQSSRETHSSYCADKHVETYVFNPGKYEVSRLRSGQ